MEAVAVPRGIMESICHSVKVGVRRCYLSRRFKGTVFERGTVADEACTFEEGVVLKCNARVWRSRIGRYSYIGHDSEFQDCTIGRFCSVAPYVLCGLGQHPLDGFVAMSPTFYRNPAPCLTLVEKTRFLGEYAPIHIGSDVWIGTRAIIKDGVSIGHGAVVGAGAVVTKDVPPYAIVGGVPADMIRYRFSKEIIDRLLAMSWWDRDIDWIRSHIDSFGDIEKFVLLD